MTLTGFATAYALSMVPFDGTLHGAFQTQRTTSSDTVLEREEPGVSHGYADDDNRKRVTDC